MKELSGNDLSVTILRINNTLKRSIALCLITVAVHSSQVGATEDKCVPDTVENVGQDTHELQENRLEQMSIAVECIKKRTGRELGSFALSNIVPGLYLALPVKFEPFKEISIDLIRSDAVAAQSLDGTFAGVLRAFNIQVVARNEELIWPDEATMVFTLQKENHVITLETPMRREYAGALVYVFDDPIGTLQLIETGIADLNRLTYSSHIYEHINPNLKIKRLTGFEDVIEQAFDTNFPEGEPVTYSYRLGITRLKSSSLYLGRPHEFVSLMPQFELFQ